MAEIIMTFALGFLIASAIALILAAPLWRRAARVTEKRLRASSPVSLDDFNADKDRMRAEFAMSARKLELSVENLRKKSETRLAELDKRERQVASLKDELEEKTSAEGRLNEELAVLKQTIADAESSLKRRDTELSELRTRLGEAQNVLARQAVAIREANSLVEGHRADIDVLTRNVESKADEIKRRAEEFKKKASEVEERDTALANCGRSVAEQKMIVGELKRERVAHMRQIAALEDERDAATRDGELASSQAREAARQRDDAVAAFRKAEAEVAALKAQSRGLAEEFAERSRSEQRESALLRERLGDLTIEIERATGDIDALMTVAEAVEEQRQPDGNHAAIHPAEDGGSAMVGGPTPLSLAERIRALGDIRPH